MNVNEVNGTDLPKNVIIIEQTDQVIELKTIILDKLVPYFFIKALKKYLKF